MTAVIEKALFEKLKLLAGGRVYALKAPQNCGTPFIVFQRVDLDAWSSLRGPSGVDQATIQIDVYDREYYAAKKTSSDVRDILNGFRGDVTYGVAPDGHTVTIQGSTLQTETELLDQTDDPVLVRILSRYLVTFKQ